MRLIGVWKSGREVTFEVEEELRASIDGDGEGGEIQAPPGAAAGVGEEEEARTTSDQLRSMSSVTDWLIKWWAVAVGSSECGSTSLTTNVVIGAPAAACVPRW